MATKDIFTDMQESVKVSEKHAEGMHWDSGLETTWSALPEEIRQYWTSFDMLLPGSHLAVQSSLEALKSSVVTTLEEVIGKRINVDVLGHLDDYLSECLKTGQYTICEDGSVNIDLEVFTEMIFFLNLGLPHILYKDPTLHINPCPGTVKAWLLQNHIYM